MKLNNTMLAKLEAEYEEDEVDAFSATETEEAHEVSFYELFFRSQVPLISKDEVMENEAAKEKFSSEDEELWNFMFGDEKKKKIPRNRAARRKNTAVKKKHVKKVAEVKRKQKGEFAIKGLGMQKSDPYSRKRNIPDYRDYRYYECLKRAEKLK